MSASQAVAPEPAWAPVTALAPVLAEGSAQRSDWSVNRRSRRVEAARVRLLRESAKIKGC